MEDGIVSIPLLGQPLSDGDSSTGKEGKSSLFREFLAGPENRLAAVAVQSILEAAEGVFSPLVFYGPSGTGKSHLALGLATAWTARFRRRPAVYITGIDFARELADAIDTQAIDDFRDRFRRISLFVLDDLGHLTNKKTAQQELIGTLDVLEQRGGRVVITASRPPGQLAGLLRPLVGRLSSGLLVPLARPGADARLAIVRRLAVLRAIELDDAAIRAVAEAREATVPELFGTVLQLEMSSTVDGTEIDAALVRKYLAEISGTKTPSFHEIATATSRYFALKVSDLRSPSRRRTVVTARGVAMYLARTLTGKSLNEIGRYFGGRDHTTVSYGCSNIERLQETEPAIREAIAELHRRLRVA